MNKTLTDLLKNKNKVTFGIRILRFKHRLVDLYYYFRALIFPYNVIKIKNIPRTWTDTDYRMLYVNFQLLE